MNKFELLNTALNGVERLTDIGTQAEVDALIVLIEHHYGHEFEESNNEIEERIISAKQLKAVRFADESPLIEEMENEN